MDFAKNALVWARAVVKEGPLGILLLIIGATTSLIFELLPTGDQSLIDNQRITFLAAISILAIFYLATLVLIIVSDRRQR